MNQPASKPPNYTEVIRNILSSVNDPIAIKDLTDRVLLMRPSNAKNPRLAAIAKIHEEQGRQLVYMDLEHVFPMRLAFQNARYRIRLTRENIDQSALSIYDCFHNYLPSNFKEEDISLVDSQGNSIPCKAIKPPHSITFSTENNEEYQQPAIVLNEWFHSQKMSIKDHILVTVKDWEKGIFQIERERFEEQHLDLLAEQNRYFADEMYKMLESEKHENVHVHVVLPTVYARMQDKGGYPPDHWMVIVNNDPRMITDGWSIRYPDSGFTLLDRLFADATGQSLIAKGHKSSKEEAKHIYRFRALLKHKPSIWREIEIQGRQTLEDLDQILRIAFNHDTFDHLSGFWKKVIRTGSSKKRFREVDIGTVNPFESADGSDTEVATLKLAVGDQIKYVYDFGDWIEHTLELLAINDAEKNISYPREIARNKPKLEYCTECRKEQKETIATWDCYTCSNKEQRDILLCEKCLNQHEEHYVDKIIY